MRLHLLGLACLVSYISSTLAVFQDDAYHTDYHHALLGLPLQHSTFFHRPSPSSKATLLYTLSEKNILGAVNPKDGAVIWRQLLSSTVKSSPGLLRAGQDEAVVVSAVGQHVRAWDARDGKLVWSAEFADGVVTDLEVMESVQANDVDAKDSLVLLGHEGHGIIRRLHGDSGDVVWEHHDKSGDRPFQVSSSASTVYYIALHAAGRSGYKIRVTSLDPVTGKQTGQCSVSSETDVSSPDSILFVGANSASPIIAWADKAMKVLKVNVIGSNPVHSFPVVHESGEATEEITLHAPHLFKSRAHFLVHYQTATAHWAEVYHVDIAASTVTKAYNLPKLAGKGAFSTSTEDANVYFTRNTESEVVLVSSASHGILERWPVASARGTPNDGPQEDYPLHAVSEVIAKSEKSYAVRSALLLADGNWNLIRNGEPGWTRTEALAGAVAAEWAELTEEEELAHQLEVEGHEDVLTAYIHRVRRHVKDLQHLPAWLQELPERILTGFTGEDKKPSADSSMHRDSFGFRKLVIVATEHGRLYALDTAAQGAVVWSRKVVDLLPGEVWDVKIISADAKKGTVSAKGSKGDFVMVETVTGQVLHRLPPGSSPPLESAVSVEGDVATFILDVYEDGDPRFLPAAQRPKGKPTLVVRGRNDVVRGTRFIADGSILKPATVWEFSAESGAHIAAMTARPRHDPVASIGRVLGDRSVMYKYLNPNLLVIITVDDASAVATVHLLDSISGEILYTATQDGVDSSRPITAVISENWFVYSFWSDATDTLPPSTSKGHKMVVAELYESDMPNDRGPLGPSANYSSIRPSSSAVEFNKPYVISQSFVIPEEISNMVVTQTRQGITSRSILATLGTSNAIIAIPKNVLDPRRPLGRDPIPAEAEEGLAKYAPSLEFNPEWVITHTRQVMGIKKVLANPALLESTSLVFAYGIDVFGTRVTPSLAFDILGKGFGKAQLLMTVVALGVGVVVFAPMVRRKQINTRWHVS